MTKTAPPAAGVSRANGVAAPPALPPYACRTSGGVVMCWLITFGVMFLACVFFAGELAGRDGQ